LLEDNEKYTVLLIEDNPELISLMSKKLNKSFNIIKSNGTDAIELAIEQIPDLVICDINLVDKNGFQISKELKEDLRTSHIPIIILTALNNQTSMLKALESGVDLYLTKPFSFRVLLQSIKSLLYNREKLRFYFSNNIHKVDELEFGKPQQQFIVQLNKLIDDNIKNSNFGVEQIASSMSLSRSQLYRKVKALLGINISEYMMDRRLELSKEFLKDTSLNIAEVAFEVGFSTPNYFSTSFKIKYGISPKEFRDKNS
jgi:YesN/AraC family two-component response regulator